MKKKKLLFIYEELNTGGSTTSLLNLLDIFDYERYEVDLLCYRMPSPEHCSALGLSERVRVLDGAAKYGKSRAERIIKAGILALSPSFHRALRARKRCASKYVVLQNMSYARLRLSKGLAAHYDAAVSFIEGWSNSYLLSDKVSADKKIAFIHLDYPHSGLDPELDRAAFARADRIALVSEHCREGFISLFPEYEDKAVCVRNVFSPEKLRLLADTPSDADKNGAKHYDFITVCRPDIYVKGLDRLTEAAAKLKRSGRSFSWGIVGVPPESELSELIRRNGVEDHVFPIGSRLNPYPYFKTADWLVLTSRFEACPMVVTEAHILACPCIVTEYPSASEQIKNGVNGIVTENSVDGIFSALCRVLDQRSLRSEFSERLKTESFSNPHEAERLYALL